MVDIQTISIVIASASVVAGVVGTVLQLRNLVKTRQANILLQLHSTWGSKEYRDSFSKVMDLEYEDYKDFVRKYGPWRRDAPLMMAIWNISDFFEVLGVLVHRKLADVGLIADMFPLTMAWEKLKVIQRERRKEIGPTLFEWFEHLYNEIKKREQKPKQSEA